MTRQIKLHKFNIFLGEFIRLFKKRIGKKVLQNGGVQQCVK